MPETTEQYHHVPVKDAGDFVDDSFKTITISEDKGIKAVIGKLKSDPDGSTVVQKYLFDVDKWTMEEAKAWVKEHEKKEGMLDRLQKLWFRVQAAFKDAFAEGPGERAIAGWDMMDQVYAQMRDSDEEVVKYAWPIDFFFDGGELYMVVTSEGKLYRAKIDVDEASDTVILGEWQQIKTEHVPVESRVMVHRQADGKYRLVAVANTAILNRVGEIDSMAMFDKFIERAEESGQYPYITFYHITHPDALPSFRMGQCDYLARDGEVYIASGILDEDSELGPHMIRALEEEPDDWGDSVGFYPRSAPELVEIGGVKIPVYEDGEHVELSLILERDAAALFTALRQEVVRMDERIIEALQRLGLSEEKVAEFSQLVDGIKDRVRSEGLITRTEENPPAEIIPPETPLEAAPPVEPAAVEPPAEQVAPEEAATELVLTEEDLPALAEGLLASEPFQEALAPILTGLVEVGAKVEELLGQLTGSFEEALEPIRQRLEELERTDEQKREQWAADLPAKRQLVITHRPRDGGDGEVKPRSYADVAQETLEKVP